MSLPLDTKIANTVELLKLLSALETLVVTNNLEDRYRRLLESTHRNLARQEAYLVELIEQKIVEANDEAVKQALADASAEVEEYTREITDQLGGIIP